MPNKILYGPVAGVLAAASLFAQSPGASQSAAGSVTRRSAPQIRFVR